MSGPVDALTAASTAPVSACSGKEALSLVEVIFVPGGVSTSLEAVGSMLSFCGSDCRPFGDAVALSDAPSTAPREGEPSGVLLVGVPVEGLTILLSLSNMARALLSLFTKGRGLGLDGSGVDVWEGKVGE